MKPKYMIKVLNLATAAFALGTVAASAVPMFDAGAYVDSQSTLYVKWTFNRTDLPMVNGPLNWAANLNTYNFVLGTDSPTTGSYWAGTTLKIGKAVDLYPPAFLSDFDIRVALTGVHSFTSLDFPAGGTAYPLSPQSFNELNSDISWSANWQGVDHGSGKDLYRASITYSGSTGNGVVVLEGLHNVPDAGAAAGLLGLALAGLGVVVRRKD